MADYRSLEINVAHARHLKNVNFMSNMESYVVVSLSSDPQTRFKTPVDRTGNKNPTWNFSIKFVIDVAAPRLVQSTLTFSILCERALGDKVIGEVCVAITDLFASLNTRKASHVAYQVKRPSGRGKGELNFSYQWGGKQCYRAPASPAPSAPPLPKQEVAMTAYPFVPGTSSGVHQTGHESHGETYTPVVGYTSHPSPSYVGYPPLHQYSNGYSSVLQPYGGYPSPHHYGGYQMPPGSGYGYLPTRPAPKMSNKTGLGLGAGLLGGLLVGELLF